MGAANIQNILPTLIALVGLAQIEGIKDKLVILNILY